MSPKLSDGSSNRGNGNPRWVFVNQGNSLEGTTVQPPALAFALLAALLPGAEPPVRATAAGQAEYVYVPDTKRLVALVRGDDIGIGHLDSAGTFMEDLTMPVIKVGMGTSGLNYHLLNGGPGTAYEYRSARLILGEIDDKGNFLPDLGSKVIAFEQYQPGGNAPPIYNLPGRFVKKREKKAKGKP